MGSRSSLHVERASGGGHTPWTRHWRRSRGVEVVGADGHFFNARCSDVRDTPQM
jgi:hypothetical protein